MKLRIGLLVAAIFLVACHGALEHEPGNLQVTIALEGSTLEIIDTRDVGELDNPPVEHHGVKFVFTPSDGSAAIEGEVPDTRIIRSEWNAIGEPDPRELIAPAGLLEVRLPSEEGRLELRGADDEVLGVVDIDPDAPVTRQAALLNEADLVRNPVKIVNHGSRDDKLDILFLSEGYKESELSSFRRHVQSITNDLARIPGYREHWSGFNVMRWDVRSRTRGTGSNGRPNDTAFETASGVSGLERCVFFANSRGQAAARDLGRRVGADVTVVLVNSTMHGGCAMDGVVVSSRPQYVAEVVAHEIAHGLFDLADEYEHSRPGGRCSTGPNVSSSATRLPWSSMVNTNQLPTPASAPNGTIGAFEGAGYCSTGRYRPTKDCMMRSLHQDMCPVCRQVIARTMAPYTGSSSSSSSGGGGSTSTGSSTGSSSSSGISAPRGLTPDLTAVSSTDVRLEWDRVSGASNYRVEVQRESGGSWRTFGNTETNGTVARVTLQPDGGRYRWNVQACDNAGCATSLHAIFTYNPGGSTSTGTTNTGTSGGTSSSGGVPAIPGDLKPTDSTATSDQTPSMSWDSVSGASFYNFKMVHQASQGSWPQYVSPQRVDGTRVSTTLREPERWYAFAVQACNASGCSAWTEWSRFYFRP